MTEEELIATCEDARRQIAAMPEWKQRWLESYMGRNGPPPKDQRPVGFLPPPPPARRPLVYGISPVAQSARVTTANIEIVEAAMRLAEVSGSSPEVAMGLLERALNGSGTNQPAGVITAGKPKAVEPPKIDKPRKRKVTLE